MREIAKWYGKNFNLFLIIAGSQVKGYTHPGNPGKPSDIDLYSVVDRRDFTRPRDVKSIVLHCLSQEVRLVTGMKVDVSIIGKELLRELCGYHGMIYLPLTYPARLKPSTLPWKALSEREQRECFQTCADRVPAEYKMDYEFDAALKNVADCPLNGKKAKFLTGLLERAPPLADAHHARFFQALINELFRHEKGHSDGKLDQECLAESIIYFQSHPKERQDFIEALDVFGIEVTDTEFLSAIGWQIKGTVLFLALIVGLAALILPGLFAHAHSQELVDAVIHNCSGGLNLRYPVDNLGLAMAPLALSGIKGLALGMAQPEKGPGQLRNVSPELLLWIAGVGLVVLIMWEIRRIIIVMKVRRYIYELEDACRRGQQWLNSEGYKELLLIREKLIRTGRSAVPQLIKIIIDTHSCYESRGSVAEILGKIGDRRAVKPLLQALPSLKYESIEALC